MTEPSAVNKSLLARYGISPSYISENIVLRSAESQSKATGMDAVCGDAVWRFHILLILRDLGCDSADELSKMVQVLEERNQQVRLARILGLDEMLKPATNGLPLGEKELSQAFEAVIFHLYQRNHPSSFQACIREMIDIVRQHSVEADMMTLTRCPLCSMYVRKPSLDLHMKSKCNKRRIQCDRCALEISFEEHARHRSTCRTTSRTTDRPPSVEEERKTTFSFSSNWCTSCKEWYYGQSCPWCG